MRGPILVQIASWAPPPTTPTAPKYLLKSSCMQIVMWAVGILTFRGAFCSWGVSIMAFLKCLFSGGLWCQVTDALLNKWHGKYDTLFANMQTKYAMVDNNGRKVATPRVTSGRGRKTAGT